MNYTVAEFCNSTCCAGPGGH